MKKYLFIIFLVLYVFISARNLISYTNTDYNVKIYYPEDYKKLLNKNGVVFYNEEKPVAFSLLFSESKYSAKEHLQRLEKQLGVSNLLDSTQIVFTDKEKKQFNVDKGYRSYIKLQDNINTISKTIIAMQKDNIVYLILVEFDGTVDEEEVDIINDCIASFKILNNNE